MRWFTHQLGVPLAPVHRSRFESMANLATACILGLAVYRLATMNADGEASREVSGPIPIEDAVGTEAPTLGTQGDGLGGAREISLVGDTTVLYLFATTCKFCAEQKTHIAEFLGSLTGIRILTASAEEPAVLEGYWGTRRLPTVALDQAALEVLSARGVPAMYLIDENGKIQRAWLGSMRHWPVGSIYDAFLK